MTILRGHGNTMDTTRWPRKVVEWVTREKCEGGRPKGGCREDMKEAVEGRNSAEEGCYRREGREETGGGGGEKATAVKCIQMEDKCAYQTKRTHEKKK